MPEMEGGSITDFISNDERESPTKLDKFIEKHFFTYDSKYSLQKMLNNKDYDKFTETLSMVMGFFDDSDKNTDVIDKYFYKFLNMLEKV